VILVEQSPALFHQPSLLWLMVGRRRLKDITRRTDHMRAAGAEVLCGTAHAVDTVGKTVLLEDGRTLRYDQLILAPGSDATRADTEELAAAGHNLYTPEGALGIYEAIQRFRGGRVVIVVTSRPIKCPPAVFEAASLLREWFAKKGLAGKVDIYLHVPETGLLPEAGPRVGQAFRNRLRAHGVTLHTGRRFLNVDPESRLVHFASGPVPYDLLIYVARHRAPEVVARSGLLDEHGWIPVDPFTLQTRHEDVYAVGDVNRIPLPSGYDLPKMGAPGHFQSFVVAHNLQRRLAGKPPNRFFGGKGACLVETGSSAFAYFGDIYRQKPRFVVFPENRLWLAGKWLIEKTWLYEHSR
jgi:sulfide:quinone oxidoreductase